MIVVRPVLENAPDPIDVSCDPDSKITDVKLLRSKKASSSILVTDAGIVIVVRPVLENALSPIESNDDPDSKITDAKL